MPSFCRAQDQIQIQDEDISVEVTPASPEPYEDVTISLTSYSTDLNKAIITWRKGSEVVISGIGKTSYSFKTNRAGSIMIFDIDIIPAGAMTSISKRITITPSEVEIMWESADGYVPPFYRGKSLPVNGGLIRVVAIPNTDSIQSGIGSITYTWQKAGEAVQDASGYNKNYYVFKNNMMSGSNEVTAMVSSVDGNYTATKTIDIPLFDPKIIFYKKSPTEGTLYNNAINGGTYMPEDEATIVAEPYFMSMDNGVDNLSYTWQINGNNIQTPAKKKELTIRPTSHGGYATMNITIENMKELFEKVTGNLKINL